MMPTQTELLALLDYDPLTGELSWKSGKPAFTATDKHGYRVGSVMNKQAKAHRVIWKMVHGTEPAQIDHEDHNRSNNRLTNLRPATMTINQQNTKKSSNNTSGVTGVSFDRVDGKWLAAIGVNGKRKTLGRFKDKEDAIKARKDAEKLYGYHPNHGS